MTTFSYDTGHKLSNTLDQTDSFTPSGSGAIAQSYLGPGQAELVSAGSVGLVNDLLGVGVRSAGGASTYSTRPPEGSCSESTARPAAATSTSCSTG